MGQLLSPHASRWCAVQLSPWDTLPTRRSVAAHKAHCGRVPSPPLCPRADPSPCVCAPGQGLREVTKQEGALLCFDEVMTGFRISKVGGHGWA